MTPFDQGHRPKAYSPQRSSNIAKPGFKPRRPNPGECNADKVQEICQSAGFVLPGVQATQLADYLNLLMQWNKAMNLVGGRDWLETLENLVMDSLWLGRFLDEQVCPAIGNINLPQIWDLGAGAGLPGIPLRIVWQAGTEAFAYHLVEAREKRALFLSTVLTRLALPDTHVFRGRAEQFMADKKAALILSRAFMPWRDVLALVREHIVADGRVILLTLEPLFAEENNVPEGWKPVEHMRYQTAGGVRYFCSFTPISAPS